MNPIILKLGPFTITWYAFLIVSAILIAYFLAKKELVIHHQDIEIFDNYIFYLIIFAILGARTWYVCFNYSIYQNNVSEIFAIWHGGLAIHGGIIGGLLTTIYFSKKYYFNLYIYTDAMVPGLILGQSIGRWGNFINQEAHGPKTTYSFLSKTLHLPDFIVQGMQINGEYYQPTFLYESLWNLLGFIIIMFILKRYYRFNYSVITAFYMIWYGVIRFFIEILRTDALMFYSIKVAQLASLIMIIGGVILLIILWRKNAIRN